MITDAALCVLIASVVGACGPLLMRGFAELAERVHKHKSKGD